MISHTWELISNPKTSKELRAFYKNAPRQTYIEMKMNRMGIWMCKRCGIKFTTSFKGISPPGGDCDSVIIKQIHDS